MFTSAFAAARTPVRQHEPFGHSLSREGISDSRILSRSKAMVEGESERELRPATSNCSTGEKSLNTRPMDDEFRSPRAS
jgi:hypothetical protein